MIADILESYLHVRDVVDDLGRANLVSMVRDDGVDWARAVKRRKPYYTGKLPDIVMMALRDVWAEGGLSQPELLRWLGPSFKGNNVHWLADSRVDRVSVFDKLPDIRQGDDGRLLLLK